MNTFKNKIQNATNFVIHNLKIPDKRQKKIEDGATNNKTSNIKKNTKQFK